MSVERIFVKKTTTVACEIEVGYIQCTLTQHAMQQLTMHTTHTYTKLSGYTTGVSKNQDIQWAWLQAAQFDSFTQHFTQKNNTQHVYVAAHQQRTIIHLNT
jgi:hypothetical protein